MSKNDSQSTDIGNREVFNEKTEGACHWMRDRPILLPVGDEEEERQRGDDKVDEEDHEQPAHDISEV